MSEVAARGPVVASAAAGTEQAWLERQCRLLNARAGLVVTQAAGTYSTVALFPARAAAETLLDLVERSFTDASGLYGELDETGFYGLAYPIRRDDAVVAVAAVAVRATSDAAVLPLLRELEWGAAGLTLILERGAAAQAVATSTRLSGSLDSLATLLGHLSYDQATLAFVTDLANRTGADRVGYGTLRRGRMRLQALSHSAEFGRKMNLARLLEQAMEEATDQRATTAYPALDLPTPPLCLAQQHLSEEEGRHAVASIPLFENGRPVAALTLERPLDQPFAAAELEWLESLGALAVAVLEEKRRNAAPLPAKIWGSTRAALGKLLGRGHVEWKLAAIVLVAAGLFLGFAEGQYRLSATATLTSRTQQAITAPYDGYVRSAPVRAGDRVQEGALLVQLDDHDLVLERLRLAGELARSEAQYQRAVAERDRSRMNILTAEREQYTAQIALATQQLGRARIVSPFAGLVATGDLSQRLGAAVQKGDVLFAVAPTDDYRIDLQVRESRIADVQPGQRGTLFLSARPERGLPFTVHRLTPRVMTEDSRTHFIVEALLDERPDVELQPGLQGIGKIEIDQRPIASIWSRDLREWLRLLVWSWWA